LEHIYNLESRTIDMALEIATILEDNHAGLGDQYREHNVPSKNGESKWADKVFAQSILHELLNGLAACIASIYSMKILHLLQKDM